MDRPSILRRWESIPPFSFKKLKNLSEERNIREDRNLILEYNYNLAQLNYIFCVYFCGLLQKILYKKNNFEYVE